MKKNIKNIFSFMMAFLLLFTTIFPHRLLASGENSLDFEINKFDVIRLD